MDPLFVASPAEVDIADALRLWPELAGKQVRPLLVSAFGDVFVETTAGEVWVASPIELTCEQVARSTEDLERLFEEPSWAQARLLTDVALLARERGVDRQPHQVFAVAPHPCFTGSVQVEQLVPMDLVVWHNIAAQLRSSAQPTAPGGTSGPT